MQSHDVEQYWQQFLSIIASCEDTQKLKTLLTYLLTHDEREMIATRMALTDALLRKEKPQRAIASEFELSIALITRGSNELKRLSTQQLDDIQSLLDIAG